jgi:hypothetical protein
MDCSPARSCSQALGLRQYLPDEFGISDVILIGALDLSDALERLHGIEHD